MRGRCSHLAPSAACETLPVMRMVWRARAMVSDKKGLSRALQQNGEAVAAAAAAMKEEEEEGQQQHQR